MRRERLVDVEVIIKFEKEKAWLVISMFTGKEAWVPKFAGELDGKIITMPEWMAKEKELI